RGTGSAARGSVSGRQARAPGHGPVEDPADAQPAPGGPRRENLCGLLRHIWDEPALDTARFGVGALHDAEWRYSYKNMSRLDGHGYLSGRFESSRRDFRMSVRSIEALHRYLRLACDEAMSSDDAVLLTRFVAADDGVAFQLLIG